MSLSVEQPLRFPATSHGSDEEGVIIPVAKDSPYRVLYELLWKSGRNASLFRTMELDIPHLENRSYVAEPNLKRRYLDVSGHSFASIFPTEKIVQTAEFERLDKVIDFEVKNPPERNEAFYPSRGAVIFSHPGQGAQSQNR